MMADGRNIDSSAGSAPGRVWADAWHLWKIIIPRRSIAGRLVWGTVWRRNQGGRWIYKKFIEYSDDGDPKTVS
jgi:hypothetical protein